MNMPKELIPKFERYLVTQRGLEVNKSKQVGEILRTIVGGENLLIVREFELRRTAASVEVFCSDKDLLKRIEQEFYEWMVETGEVTLEDVEKEKK